MSRFFLTEQDVLRPPHIELRGENFHHLARVLRARIGERVEISDGNGTDYICVAEGFEKESAMLRIEESILCPAESGPRITLYQCVAKGDKMEQIITRSIEMGVSRIVPVHSRYCVARLDNDKKLERYRKIALAAAKQSGRGIVPQIAPVMEIGQAIREMKQSELAFVCYEKEDKATLADLPVASEISFLIGSEGGLSEEECALWQAEGIPAVSLGQRILRTENAATFVLPILSYKSQTEV